MTLGFGGNSIPFEIALSPTPIVPFPVPAHRTQRANFQHWALQWDHALRTLTTKTKPRQNTPSFDAILRRYTPSVHRHSSSLFRNQACLHPDNATPSSQHAALHLCM